MKQLFKKGFRHLVGLLHFSANLLSPQLLSLFTSKFHQMIFNYINILYSYKNYGIAEFTFIEINNMNFSQFSYQNEPCGSRK
jgi:hypothetical protein